MRTLFLNMMIGLLPFTIYAQTDSLKSADSSIRDLITISTVNNHDVFSSERLNKIVHGKLKKANKVINDKRDHPKVYFINRDGTKFFEIWGGPDLGYGWFYIIGYTKNKKCTNCAYLGSINDPDFVIDQGIKLGDDLSNVWPKVHLNCFRSFSFKGIEYFYFEKGMAHEIPFTPNQIFFYKFKNEKLIEIGFGNGMIGENPMLHTQ